ncbi:uncharacterized protein LOC114273924 [Camellia sinensis]|uniref:uncharacterized protein LOC114273924 n=1 Tax=Camellia sinensis TaxID=4442 RepID=UPI0010356DDA|nr:uncharacterized protein LOC114273924 [Camellia sinensis]
MEIGLQMEFCMHKDGTLRFGERLCVPNDLELKREILRESHSSGYTVHPRSTKMYKDLKRNFSWDNMKRELLRLPRTQGGNNAIWVIVDRLTKSAHFLAFKVGFSLEKFANLYIKDIVKLHVDKINLIRERLRTAQSRQKSYADNKRHDLVFGVGDHVFLKVSPMKGVMRFDVRGKLSPRFVGPFEVLDRIGEDIVKLHGIPMTIVSERDSRFVSMFWRSLHTALGISLNFSTSFHPQTDGQSERTIQTLEDMLRACVIDLGGSWDEHLAIVEFSYNNSYHVSI